MANKYIRLGYTGASGGGSSFVKDPVANPAALPSSGNNAGDLRYVLSVNQWYKWDGAEWDSWIEDLDSSRAMITDANGLPDSSSVTTTELGYVSGVTSGIQSQINSVDNKASNLVTLSGVAANATDLGTFTGAIIPDNATNKSALQSLETAIQNLPDPMEYKGSWNASTNSPALSDGTGNNGDVYYVSVAGSQFSPSITFGVGDKAVYNGATAKWEKWDVTEAVSSVNGYTGAVVLTKSDVGLGNVDNVSDANKPVSTATQTALDLKVDENSPITGATKTKITYDAKGLVTVGADATTADIADSTNKRYVTDANLTVINNTSGTNTGDQNLSSYVQNTRTISTTAPLTGGGDLSSNRNLSMPVATTLVDGYLSSIDWNTFNNKQSTLGFTAENITNKATNLSSPDNTKYPSTLAVSTALALKPNSSTGDINETSFTMANNQTSPANITGFTFNAASVRSFSATVSIAVDATSDVFEAFTLTGINRGGSFDIAISSIGDASGVTLSCTSAGQVQYQTPNYGGFISGALKFRAITTTV
jgi:hypothetical protein